MDRRSFLLGIGTLALSQVLAGCSERERATLRVQLLKGSVPARVVKEFRAALKQPAQLNFTSVEQLNSLFNELQSWSQQRPQQADEVGSRIPGIQSQAPDLPDLVTLGDYWLAPAIEQKLIRPLDPAELQQWSNLPIRWQELVRRNEQGQLDAQGQVWAAPYRWGYTVIAYNRDKFESLGWKPSDWSDLWREELRDRISLLNHPREVIGLTLKKLGQSYNTENPSQVRDLEKQLSYLHQQVKLYSSDTYIQPLVLGDTWLAVGWSTDVLPILQRYQQIEVVIPQSGTAVWADLWVHPTGKKSSTSIDTQWIDFCWQPQIAQQIALLGKANSPIPVKLRPSDIQTRLRHLLLFDPQIFQRSDFLLPLSSATMQQYQSLWQEIRIS
ncbi:extracellular solute-binding protein [Chroococcidiopsis sp. CCMEE 29]|uniref:extracellular solute-binding protein n=1 Tax=Chroococcidiopsis sp. CCMEE 29 TaxID=155894 RepID=UPI00201FD516|nr:extracellular solute-binding protein [Chroococcidiopsis sp. CCMEE 29]